MNSETFLSPRDTQISVEAMLWSVTHLERPNRYGDYEFEFHVLDSIDYHRIEELVYTSKRRAGHFRNIHMTDKTTKNGRSLICSQLFAPKLNKEFEYTGQMEGQKATLNLHLRDDKHGNIYLQCDYVDFIEEEERVIPEPPEGWDPADDF